MKKPISFILVLCMVLAMMPVMTITASAAAGQTFQANITVGGTDILCSFKVLSEPDGATPGAVQIGDGTNRAIPTTASGVLIIPSSVSNDGIEYSVTAIGNSAFYDCHNLTGNLTIPNSVTWIGNSAFNGCYNLTGNLTIPNSVTGIGDSAFNGCRGFDGVLTLSTSAAWIGHYAFNDCSKLTGNLTIPNSVIWIGDSAFGFCTSFSGIEFTSGSKLNTIYRFAFSGCSGLTGNLTLPASVNNINYMAFNDCINLTTLVLQGNSMPSQNENDVFKGCSKLVKLIVPAAWTGADSVTLKGITTPFAIGTGNMIKDAGLMSVLGQTTTASGGGLGDTTGTAINYSINVANTVTEVSSGAIVPGASSSAILYSDSAFSTEVASISIPENTPATAYIKVTSSAIGTTTTRYHAVTVSHPQPPSISINDVSLVEGHSGTSTMTFTVSLDRTWESPITVDYATANQTAIAGDDYTAASGTLTFSPGTTTQAINVTVNGDTLDENNETFYVYLGNASGGVSISDSSGIGTIIDDDDAPTISINDASVAEGNSGTTSMTFTVSLNKASGKTITVVYSTENGTATVANNDYVATSGTLTFSPGETTKTISVTVNSDTTPEPDETFYLNLSNPTNVTVSDGQGTGTILNDDLTAEALPSATKDYPNEKLTGLTPSAGYTVNGADRTADASGEIAIENSWFGTTILLVKKGNGTTTTNSAVQSIAITARPATPACTATQPTASSATGTVSGISTSMEYSTGGGIWTDGTGTDISGLAPGTVHIRVKATGGAPASLNQTITITAYSAPPTGSGGGSSTPTLVTKIESGESVASTNVDKLVKEGKSLTVEGKTGEKLLFDTEALKNIVGQTKDSVKVEIKDVSADHKNEHPDRLVVSLTITAGGKHITSFGNGTATVSLPYELKAGEKAEDVTVWYLAEDGTMSEVPCSYDPATKLATFKVNHFSLYVVGTADTSKWTNPFSDVKESNWYYDAVRYVSANGMMQGTEATAFHPGAKTTRGMIVTILWRMENEPKAAKEMTFTDVKSGKYYHDAVAWASEKGIVGGYSAEQFAPEDNITREQLAVILYNYAASKGYNMVVSAEPSGDLSANISAFSDAGKIHKWGKDAMSWANAEGLINGTGSNLLDPLGAAQRSQVAAILQRFVENTVE